ncbi:MAG TPA: hypothetical protein VFK89_01100 [Actinomycetota bacterium]|nr:hypothetical protein [Actinomycetota bacterium]
MIAGIVIAALACLAVAYVAAPLRRGAQVVIEPTRSDEVEAAADQKRTALTGILDLDEEAAAGKLAPADFAMLKDMYEREALDALQRLDEMQTSHDVDDELEREIAAARAELSCANCGALKTASSSTCDRCGAPL